MRGFLRIVAATTAYAVVHTLFASLASKKRAERWIGARNAHALYRPFYLVQSAVTIVPLIRYIRRQPGRELYALEGPAAVVCRTVQAGAIVWATASAYEVGLSEILGIRPLLELLSGKRYIAPTPEAQGPSLAREGELRIAGPFRLSQHPLNFAPFVIIWANPRMTTRLLAFNVVASVYLIVGSMHEARRLGQAYGEAYERYHQSDVPFYFPGAPRRPQTSLTSATQQ